ncbi:AAA family ATPase [Kaistia terrae]|uniref:AAA family ATPase n=1 Tax=Kaistia terrae TaxID=537017 RepID=A0ABW0PYR0_9HYPH|nr:AAA family ATPase [Kaistia terrae]MCX5581643.1 AAA family ATPase [Kaistia terrae]
MTDLFLRRVELSNFRVYGDSYGFDFDPQPGVTLIVGANGLGKTTLFDGIEWALTGEVSRFSDVPVDGRRKERNPLTRLGQPEGSHRVGVVFSDGTPIDRGQGLNPTEAEVAGLLRRPGWSEISDLHRYLSITHFLGQAASMRFSVRKPKDQWEALKGPAGVDRINHAKERLGGQAARQAFTRVIREASNRLVELNANYAAWAQLLAERDRLTQLSASEDAVAPTQLIVAANDLARRIVEVTSGLRWSDAETGEAPEALLGRLATLCATAEDRALRDQTRLRSLETRATEYAAVVSEIASLNELVAGAERRQLEATEALSGVEAAIISAEDAVAAGQRRLTEAQAQVGVLTRADVAAGQLVAAEHALQEALAGLDASDRTVEAALARQADVLQRLTQSTAQLEERGRMSAQLSNARRRLELTEHWLEIRAEILRLTELAAGTDAEALRRQRKERIAAQSAAEADVARLGAELRKLDERTSAIAEAVAAIAAHLTQEDKNCPVCNSPFAVGELLRAAQARPTGRSSSAFELADALAAAEARRTAATDGLRAVDLALAQQIQTQAAIAQQRAAEQSLMQKLAEAGDTTSSAPDLDGARTTVADLAAAFQALDSLVRTQTPLENLRAEQQAVIASLDAETARRTELMRRQAEQLGIAETARAVLRQTPEVWTAVAGLAIDIAAARAAAARRVDEASREALALQAALDAQRGQREALRGRAAAEESSVKARNLRLQQGAERRRTIAEAWTAGGLTGDPDVARLATQLALADDRISTVAQLTERQKRLSAGYRRWTDDEALRDVNRRIDQQAASAGGPDVVSAIFAAAVEDAQARVGRAERARARMETVVTGMQSKADDYAQNVLQPLNETIQRFSRVLMTWSDSAIIYRAEHLATRAELRPSAVRTERDGSTSTLEINPNLFFSEGQLSALSVSALLAASTSFRWSRWRGLLMDDPLQHNDVIHASAFMDLMRQMVHRLGYQVVMSTHDTSEAAFLMRKCESAGIPLRIHELQPPGDDGLVSAAA